MPPPTVPPASKAIRFGPWRGRALLEVDPRAFLDLLQAGLAAFLDESGRADFVKTKPEKGSRVYRTRLDLGSGEEEIFIKTFHPTLAVKTLARRAAKPKRPRWPHHYPVKILKVALSTSVAARSFRAYEACVAAGLPVASALFYLNRGTGPFREELLVTRGLGPRTAPDVRFLFDHVLGVGPRGEKFRFKRELIEELGRLLWRVKESGINFPDFKLHNLVLVEPPDARPRFFIVDLAEAKPNQPFNPEHDLLRRFAARLPGFTNANKVRLIKAYLQAGADPRPWPSVLSKVNGRRNGTGGRR